MPAQHQVNETNVMTNELSTKQKVSEQNQIKEANNMLSELSMEELDTVAGGWSFVKKYKSIWW